MICKETQNTIDTLLRFKIDEDSNKIASSTTSRQEREDLTVSIIEEMIQKGENEGFINKIATVTSKSNKQKGEVAELRSLLNLHYR